METAALNDQGLKEYSAEHLSYEIKMLLRSSKLSATDQFTVHIKIEVFAIHLRCLINFFYPNERKKPHKTDVLASHFFSNDGEWVKIRPKLPSRLELARRRIDKELAHLTVNRMSGTSNPFKHWNIPILLEEIEKIIKIFCDKANKRKLDGSIANLLNIKYA